MGKTGKATTTPQPSPCLPEHRRPASIAATSHTDTVVLASTASIPVVVVWLVVSTTTVPTWTSTIPVTSVRLVCDTSTSSRTTSGSPSSTWTSCGLLSPPRPAMPTSPDPRRTPSLSSTSSPSATPRFLAKAVSPKFPWSFAQDGSASWLRRRSRRLVVLLSWLRKYAQQLKRRRFFLSVFMKLPSPEAQTSLVLVTVLSHLALGFFRAKNANLE